MPGTPPPPRVPAGWYPDPDSGGSSRYFDGTAWTDRYAISNEAPKSAVVAGLLQLFLGWFGLGRLYLGYTNIGIAQLLLGIVGIFGTFLCWAGLVILAPLSIWVFIEGVAMIAGGIPEANGRGVR